MSSLRVDPDRVWAAAQQLHTVTGQIEDVAETLRRALQRVAAGAGPGALAHAAGQAGARWEDALREVAAAGTALARTTDVAAEGYQLAESLARQGTTAVRRTH